MSIDPLTLPRLSINMEHGDTPDFWCQVRTLEEFEQYTTPSLNFPGYGELEVNTSVLTIPDDIERDWWGLPASKWMRYEVRKASKLGYEFAAFDFNDHLDGIYAINVSMPERQGREMSAGYRTRPEPETTDILPCKRHRYDWLGVFQNGTLYAYIQAMQTGELMTLSKILGHGDRLDDGIMNLLVYEAVKRNHSFCGTRYVMYHLQDSGTEGLRFFKRKMGFVGHLVRFELRSASG